ncbi:hypothetical protein KP509_04G002800 [Ceratopteris richardii]|uniref:RING-CH-type domain-containing protein n=1 Tax=Ceratopteris richardii TaxID=49495 RepID=A0A8T2UPU9_CERRI|nr:hypothetical protein KP509_04G002800 [Ceratopteris richardii]
MEIKNEEQEGEKKNQRRQSQMISGLGFSLSSSYWSSSLSTTGAADEIMDIHPHSQLQIPSRASEGPGNSTMSSNIPRSNSGSKDYRLHNKRLLPRSSSKLKLTTLETTPLDLPPMASSHALSDSKAPQSSSFFWTRVVMPLSAKRTSSMPVNAVLDSTSPSGVSMQGVSDPASTNKDAANGAILRSFSVPTPKIDSLRRMGSAGGGTMLVRLATPRMRMMEHSDLKEIALDNDGEEGEEIPEEEAVCRICFDILDEKGEAMKLECACKGELALAHKNCALKWFGIKGNRTCDVCGQEVQNLPVTLVRVSTQNANIQVTQSSGIRRVWQDIPVLVMISMLGYFCFLEQLLVGDMGSKALAIALPFACVLGFLISVSVTTVVRQYVWIFAAFQFGLVIIFCHLFYSVITCQRRSLLTNVLSCSDKCEACCSRYFIGILNWIWACYDVLCSSSTVQKAYVSKR